MRISRSSSTIIAAWSTGVATLAIPGVALCTGSLTRDLALSTCSLGVALGASLLMRHQASPARVAASSGSRDELMSTSRAANACYRSSGSWVGQPA